jgi:hypothetical protein
MKFAWLLWLASAFEIRFESRELPFVLENGAQGDFRLVELMPGGVAAFDFDNDGCLDLFFPNGAALPSLKKSLPKYHNRLYRGDCRLGFQDVTQSAQLTGEGYSMGAAAADFDNDGLTDLFVAGVNRNLLYRNVGGGRFREVPLDTGKRWSVAAGWLDYNNDGFADLFLVNYLDWRLDSEPRCGNGPARFYCHPGSFKGLANQLFRNNGDGAFTDVSQASGIAAHTGKGMSAAFADFDRDGFADIYVANDSMPAYLFRNRGDGAFTETGVEAGVALRDDGMPIAGMGVDFRDYDNDLLPDLVVTGMINDSFLLFRNLGKRWTFDDDRARTGLLLATRQLTGWGAGIFDFDNDGWKDLFFALSHFPRLDRYTGRDAELPCRVFRNDGGRKFNGADAAPPAYYRGAAFGDFDNDGRVDVVVTALGGHARLLHNISDAGNWLAIAVSGPGASVTVTLPGSRTLSNHATTSVGYASSSEPAVRFGLGKFTSASRVDIVWPGGATRTLRDVPAGKLIRVERP